MKTIVEALRSYLQIRSLDDNNTVFKLCCKSCADYERKACLDSLQSEAKLMLELGGEAAR